MGNELFGETHEQEENRLFGKRHQAEELIKIAENKWIENRDKYLAYEGKNFDADYYLFLGMATGFGEMLDLLESKNTLEKIEKQLQLNTLCDRCDNFKNYVKKSKRCEGCGCVID